MSKKIKLDKYSYHEALDRAYLVCDIVDSHLLEHPVIQQHKELKKKVKKAVRLLAEVYQMSANIRLQTDYKSYTK